MVHFLVGAEVTDVRWLNGVRPWAFGSAYGDLKLTEITLAVCHKVIRGNKFDSASDSSMGVVDGDR